MKKEKGITLVALVITIIILLILAGITIMQLSNSGLFENARFAKEKSKESQDKENDTLLEYEIKIAEILGGGREAKLENCVINISNYGEITLENKDNVEFKCFVIFKNGKWMDITKNNSYNISIPAGTTANFYIVAIDVDGNFYKSNVVQYTSTALYLYNEGNKCTELTGGWNLEKESNTETNMDNYNYIDLNSHNGSCCGIGISTNNTINISKYTKLKMKVTVLDNGFRGTRDGYTLGADKSKITTNKWYSLDYSTSKNTEIGENIIVEYDLNNISDKATTNYYLGIQVGRFHLKIHQIWLE